MKKIDNAQDTVSVLFLREKMTQILNLTDEALELMFSLDDEFGKAYGWLIEKMAHRLRENYINAMPLDHIEGVEKEKALRQYPHGFPKERQQ